MLKTAGDLHNQARSRPTSVIAALVLLVLCYALATLPYLADFPTIEAAEIGIAAPAFKLADQGIYGNDLYQGFYRNEELNYEYMPLYPLLVSASFKFLGLSVLTGRLVSVLGGLLTILLTFFLGRELYDTRIGLVAAWLLIFLRLGVVGRTSGIPLIDLGRVIRYDIWVPVWVLASCIAFFRAYRRGSSSVYLVAGLFAGLATLTHVYGAFVLPVIWIALLWQDGWTTLRRSAPYLILIGWLLALLPWFAYILQDLDAFSGQSLRHESRFDLLNPSFYLHNLITEPLRYLNWVGETFRRPIIWPRIGFWFFVVGIGAVNVYLWSRIRRQSLLADRLTLLAPPLLIALLALLISFKRFPYVLLVLPFLALQLALAVSVGWRWASHSYPLTRWVIGLVLVAILLEGGTGIWRSLNAAQATTPYLQVTDQVAQVIPTGSRVLTLHHYWLGLAMYDARAIDLAFVRSDPRYGYAVTPEMEQVIEEFDPDYVVLQQELLQHGLTAAYAAVNPPIARQWHEFDEYLGNHCSTIVRRISDFDYGNVLVHRCE